MSKIVVTGALGHIGSRLIRDLPEFENNVEIIMIDNFSTQRYASLFNLNKAVKYFFHEGDITQLNISHLIRGADAVIHLAAITDAANSFEKEDIVEKNNFGGTKLMAEACLHENVPLIFPSSTSVYGVQTDVVDENCAEADLKPQSPYAGSKLREEKLLKEMVKSRGLRASILRFGTIYGTSKGMRFHTAVNKFCWQAVTNQSISVWETAYEQKRPYLDLVDAIQAIKFIIQNSLFNGEVYNVVTENKTVKDVLELIQKSIPKIEIEFVNTRIMNQLSYDTSSEKLKKLGFKFTGNMEVGVRHTIELLRNMNYTTASMERTI